MVISRWSLQLFETTSENTGRPCRKRPSGTIWHPTLIDEITGNPPVMVCFMHHGDSLLEFLL
jgi:hypothetical protein